MKIEDRQGNTPLDLADKHKKDEALKLLKNGPLQEESEYSKKLLASFKKGDNATVLKMLKSSEADVHAANENGTT